MNCEEKNEDPLLAIAGSGDRRKNIAYYFCFFGK